MPQYTTNYKTKLKGILISKNVVQLLYLTIHTKTKQNKKNPKYLRNLQWLTQLEASHVPPTEISTKIKKTVD